MAFDGYSRHLRRSHVHRNREYALAQQLFGFLMQPTAPAYAEEAIPKDRYFLSAAIEQQYTRLQPSLVRFLMGFGLARTDAEDITHDTFVKSLRRRSSAHIDNLFHWLCTCAKNLAITRHHRNKRELLFTGDCWNRWEEAIASPACDAHTRLEEKQALEELGRAFRTLTRRERQCLILRSQGATFRELSEALHISMRAGVYATGAALRKLHRELNVSEL